MCKFAIVVLRVKLTFSQSGRDIKINRLQGRKPLVNIFLLKSHLCVYDAEISERLDLHVGWARPDLGIQIATFFLLFSPVNFVLRYGEGCDERGFGGTTSVHMVMVYIHAMQQICAPLEQSSLPELGRREQCCWVKQAKTLSKTANQGLEKSRESVGRSPPISVLIFVYASVKKKQSGYLGHESCLLTILIKPH